MIAVKKFNHQAQLVVEEKQFENEVYHLMNLKHPNIVRFVGYCYQTQHECVEHNGRQIFAETQRSRLLCLEYLPKGSLDRHLSGMTTTAFSEFSVVYLAIKRLDHGETPPRLYNKKLCASIRVGVAG